MNIPDSAVEAATMAIYRINSYEGMHFELSDYRRDARAALEAAAPHLMAQAWDEGEQAGAMNHAIEEYPELPAIANPYRVGQA